MLRTKERLPTRQLDTGQLPDHQIVRADSRELLEACYRLRYQVYCVENPFEDPKESPNGLEMDAYEGRSLHALVVHRPSGIPVATVRLILPDMCVEPPLPFLSLCKHPLLGDSTQIPMDQVAEISRFAVSKMSRRLRRPPELLGADGKAGRGSSIDPREAPTVALVRAFVALAAQNDIHILFALMEKGLIRRANLLGIRFVPVGPPVEHHGLRQPCVTVIKDLLDNAKVRRPDVWEALTDGGSMATVFRSFDGLI